jgi:dihydropteroate synthase
MTIWQTSRFDIDLSQPRIMGIVNVTPDSFSDGGLYASTSAALRHCDQLLAEGAEILDIGGESTRPGAQPLSEADELARLLPVVRHALTLGVPVSVDTYKPAVMQTVLDLGVDIINDVWALRWITPGAARSGVDVVAGHDRCGVCLMHMHGDPQTMQVSPMEGDVLAPVLEFLRQRTEQLLVQGVQSARICIDPGIGFGKTVSQNFSLLARQSELLKLELPVLAGWSRKSSLGAVTGALGPERVVASAAAALLAVHNGACVVRVHDVLATVHALKVLGATQAAAKN